MRLPAPFWLRDGRGKLEWVNKAYARLVEAGSPEAVLREERELLSENAREAVARHHLAAARSSSRHCRSSSAANGTCMR